MNDKWWQMIYDTRIKTRLCNDKRLSGIAWPDKSEPKSWTWKIKELNISPVVRDEIHPHTTSHYKKSICCETNQIGLAVGGFFCCKAIFNNIPVLVVFLCCQAEIFWGCIAVSDVKKAVKVIVLWFNMSWVVPLSMMPVTTRIMIFLVGNHNLNLQLPLESWEGGQPKIWSSKTYPTNTQLWLKYPTNTTKIGVNFLLSLPKTHGFQFFVKISHQAHHLPGHLL